MKASELRGRAIVSLDQAEKIGAVDDLLLDFGTNEVREFTVRPGLLGGTKYIRAQSIRNVGPDAITIPDRSVLEDQGLRASDSPQLASLSGLLGSKVVSEQGALLGTLGDVVLDSSGLRVACFEMSGNLWDKLTGSEKTFNAMPGIRMGSQLVVVPDAIAQELSGRQEPAVEPPLSPANEPNTLIRPPAGTGGHDGTSE
jgi:uncharacterized protein YrrD